MTALIASFIFIILAEMGDKTQLLAMAFAARYRATVVLAAVFVATFVNHTLAVVTGHLLTKIIPINIISFIASLSFIFFGLWTLRGDQLDKKEAADRRFGPFLTVALAFFLAEMGDKTQLATISLAIKYQNIISVLLGTTSAMVVADAFGIIAGVVLRKHLPEKTIKWVAAITFIIFGCIGIYTQLAGIGN
jgi:putative Ca2+/H+ antiporter (TMEM165/GDT1 family)